MAVRVPVPPAGGASVAETARALRVLQLALAAIRHETAAAVVHEPRIEAKVMLTAQLYDDARTLIKLERRLAQLPATEPVAIAGTPAKPDVLAAAREHLGRLDPVVDEHGARLLTQLVLRQERHVAELDLRPDARPIEQHGGAPQPLSVSDRPEQPAREPFVEIGSPGDGGLHDLIHAKLCIAELAAFEIHSGPDAGAGRHADLARRAADAARHALVIDRVGGGIWGSHGVPAGYVAELPPLPQEPSAVFDLLRAEAG